VPGLVSWLITVPLFRRPGGRPGVCAVLWRGFQE
jgi:hypothetical protein